MYKYTYAFDSGKNICVNIDKLSIYAIKLYTTIIVDKNIKANMVYVINRNMKE